jgi:UDP-N-acetylglucosamine 2-epimerase (non-hydrolysing)
MENLVSEGIPRERIYVIGNPIKEVIDYYSDHINHSNILSTLGLEEKKFFLVTMHRAENVDIKERLRNLVEALISLCKRNGLPAIVSLHPRTKAKIEEFNLPIDPAGVRYLTPLGFFDFIRLERAAFCLLSDSGTVQEEACIFGVPNVTIRDVTERPETVECGSNVLAGTSPETIMQLVQMVTSEGYGWLPPVEYLAEHVAMRACRIILGMRTPDLAEKDWLDRIK